jgi:hypothetical protein
MGPQLFRISDGNVFDHGPAYVRTTSPVRVPEKPGIGLHFVDQIIKI